MWTSASFQVRSFGQGFAYTEVSIFPRTEGLVSWASDYMVVVVMGMMKVSDLWQYKKGCKQFIPFIAFGMCIACAFETRRTKWKCELPTATLWVEFLSRSLWKDPIRYNSVLPLLPRVREWQNLGFIFQRKKKRGKKWFNPGQNKKIMSLPESPVNLGWKGWVFLKFFLCSFSHPIFIYSEVK